MKITIEPTNIFLTETGEQLMREVVTMDDGSRWVRQDMRDLPTTARAWSGMSDSDLSAMNLLRPVTR